jgi:LysR family pca operon transcriptional activator
MLDSRIKLRHLRTFVEVARRRSVKQAADALAVTQPAVSKTLKELEDLVEARLMDRNRAGVALTPLGEMFLHYAAAALASLAQGFDGIAQARREGERALTIGALPSVAARIIPNAVASLKQAAPEQPIRIVTGPNPYLLDLVRSGDLDLVVGRLGPPESMVGLRFSHLYSDRVAVVVRPEHPLVGTPDLGRIADHTVLFPDESAAIRDMCETLLIANGIARLPDRIDTVAATFGRTYVRKTDAVWFISYGVVALDLADGLMVELPFKVDQTLGPVGLTVRDQAAMTPAMDGFTNILRRIIDQMGSA